MPAQDLDGKPAGQNETLRVLNQSQDTAFFLQEIQHILSFLRHGEQETPQRLGHLWAQMQHISNSRL
jgi:hypothetical protein